MNDIFIQMKRDMDNFDDYLNSITTEKRLKYMTESEVRDFEEMQAE